MSATILTTGKETENDDNEISSVLRASSYQISKICCLGFILRNLATQEEMVCILEKSSGENMMGSQFCQDLYCSGFAIIEFLHNPYQFVKCFGMTRGGRHSFDHSASALIEEWYGIESDGGEDEGSVVGGVMMLTCPESVPLDA
eukprot:8640361-Ditylum_brightwellii.AAC.1